MLSAQFGALVRRGRLAKGLRQSELARAAGVSRTVVSRLEQGKRRPVQTDVLDRLFQALELDPRLEAASPGDERRRARAEHQARLERQRSRHLRLAVEIALDRRGAAGRIARAKRMVELWRRNRTCSPVYIKRWYALLALPPGELAQRMSALGEWEDALFQNTPWSFAWS